MNGMSPLIKSSSYYNFYVGQISMLVPLKLGTREEMSALTIPIQYCSEGPR